MLLIRSVAVNAQSMRLAVLPMQQQDVKLTAERRACSARAPKGEGDVEAALQEQHMQGLPLCKSKLAAVW